MPVDYLEAWSLWWSDNLPRDAVLFGIKVLWWGRIGILLELIGSMTIIAELVGATRLREFGQSLRGAITIEGLKQSVIAAGKLIRDSFVAFFFWFGTRGTEATKRMFESPHRWIYLVITLAMGTLLFATTRGNAAPTWALVLGFVSCISVSAILAPLVVALLVTAIAMLGLVAEPIIEGLAYLIEHPGLDRSLKVAGLVLIAAGIHFALLTA
jgi:hypothetical protein